MLFIIFLKWNQYFFSFAFIHFQFYFVDFFCSRRCRHFNWTFSLQIAYTYRFFRFRVFLVVFVLEEKEKTIELIVIYNFFSSIHHFFCNHFQCFFHILYTYIHIDCIFFTYFILHTFFFCLVARLRLWEGGWLHRRASPCVFFTHSCFFSFSLIFFFKLLLFKDNFFISLSSKILFFYFFTFFCFCFSFLLFKRFSNTKKIQLKSSSLEEMIKFDDFREYLKRASHVCLL